MALTKAGIVQAIAEQTSLTKSQSSQAVETLMELMKESLASGEDVLISGFGKFYVKEKSERRGRNSATGDDLMLPARRVVTFKFLGKLRNQCNVWNCGARD